MGTQDRANNIIFKSNLIEIPSGATIPQIETALDAKLNDGWKLHSFQTVGSKIYAVLIIEKDR